MSDFDDLFRSGDSLNAPPRSSFSLGAAAHSRQLRPLHTPATIYASSFLMSVKCLKSQKRSIERAPELGETRMPDQCARCPHQQTIVLDCLFQFLLRIAPIVCAKSNHRAPQEPLSSVAIPQTRLVGIHGGDQFRGEGQVNVCFAKLPSQLRSSKTGSLLFSRSSNRTSTKAS